MSDIPIELFRGLILPYVPVEDLFRFRSVCKTWRRIIDDPHFVKNHITRGIGQDWFFHRHVKGKIFLLPVNKLITSKTYVKRINATNVVTPNVLPLPDFPLNSCNGFILLSSSDNKLVWRIWNPFTGESLEIKQCSEFENVHFIPCCGIGYDEVHHDYKVVRIVYSFTWIYSVNLEKWHRVEDFPDFRDGARIVRENGVLAYGALHWVTCSWIGGWVVALDLSTGKYRKIPLPSETDGLYSFCSLNALSGCLFFICNRLRGCLVLWMIKDYGGEDPWVKMFSVEADIHMTYTPLTYLKSKNKILIHRTNRYTWYDLGNKYSKKLGIEVSTDGTDDEWAAGYQYIFSVFSSQVFPASLIRLKRSDCSDEGGTSRRTSKRLRKVPVVIERLPLKIMFGEPEDWTGH